MLSRARDTPRPLPSVEFDCTVLGAEASHGVLVFQLCASGWCEVGIHLLSMVLPEFPKFLTSQPADESSEEKEEDEEAVTVVFAST